MARKKIDLSKFEGKWVLVNIDPKDKPGVTEWLRLFVKNGQFWELRPLAIQNFGLPLFLEVKPDINEKIKEIESAPRMTPAERVLVRLEFGEPQQPPTTFKNTGRGINIKVIKSRKHKGVAILRAFGLHHYNEDPPSEEFEHNLEVVFGNNPKTIILDLSRIRRLDAIEISGLVQFYCKCFDRKIKLILCGLQPSVRDKIHFSKLHTIMPSYKTEKKALAALVQK